MSVQADNEANIKYVDYENEEVLPEIQEMVQKDLSEPYSVFTYRYFLHQWPQLSILAMENNAIVGCIISKAEIVDGAMQGYIAMLTVRESHRKRGIGLKLAEMGLKRLVDYGCTEVILETESSNSGALFLYGKLGFAREERLLRYYLNGGDAFRLKLFIDQPTEKE
jgi:peptide alpha-N-acetyltransferase